MPTIKSCLILFIASFTFLSCSQRHDESPAADEAYAPSESASMESSIALSQSEFDQKSSEDGIAATFSKELSQEVAQQERPQVPQASTPPKPRPEDIASGMFLPTSSKHKFILTANAKFKVKNVYDATIDIENIAYSLEGFVIKNDIRTNQYDVNDFPQGDNIMLRMSRYARYSELIVRLPAENTQTFLRKLADHMLYLDHREFLAQDVQFDILKQQLSYRRNQEIQQKFGRAASQVRGDTKMDAIGHQRDTMEARDNATINRAILNDRIDYSTVVLSIYEPEGIYQEKITDIQAIIDSSRTGFFVRLGESLTSGWYAFLDCIVFISVLWPLLLIAILAIAIAIYRRKRNKTAE